MTGASDDNEAPAGRRVIRAFQTAVRVALVFFLLWRAHRSVEGLTLRAAPILQPRAVLAKLTMSEDERIERSFGKDSGLFRFLDKNVAADGLVSVWGADTDDRRLLTVTLDAHLFPRRADFAERLADFFGEHPDRLNDRVLVLQLSQTAAIPAPVLERLDRIFSSGEAAVYRLKPGASWR